MTWFQIIQNFRKKLLKKWIFSISCRWKFLLFLQKKSFSKDEPWPDFQNEIFLHPCRWNFRFSEKCLSRRNRNSRKNSSFLLSKIFVKFGLHLCWVNFWKFFSSSLLSRFMKNFSSFLGKIQKCPSPPPEIWAIEKWKILFLFSSSLFWKWFFEKTRTGNGPQPWR